MTIRILYVDDDADIREIAEMALTLDSNFDVRLAGSGAEALQLAREWRPDLILLDVMMPEMDGPQVLEILRGDRDLCKIPVVFITARTQRQEVAMLKALGARSVFAKPFDPMTLSEKVKAVLHDGY